MKNEIKKYNAVIRIHSDKTGIVKERGFTNIDDAVNTMFFLEDVVDDVEIFYRLDWYADCDMPINGEYWFGKRSKREAE